MIKLALVGTVTSITGTLTVPAASRVASLLRPAAKADVEKADAAINVAIAAEIILFFMFFSSSFYYIIDCYLPQA
jgi:hypothetical protein